MQPVLLAQKTYRRKSYIFLYDQAKEVYTDSSTHIFRKKVQNIWTRTQTYIGRKVIGDHLFAFSILLNKNVINWSMRCQHHKMSPVVVGWSCPSMEFAEWITLVGILHFDLGKWRMGREVCNVKCAWQWWWIFWCKKERGKMEQSCQAFFSLTLSSTRYIIIHEKSYCL